MGGIADLAFSARPAARPFRLPGFAARAEVFGFLSVAVIVFQFLEVAPDWRGYGAA
jgi:hypothetical protein